MDHREIIRIVRGARTAVLMVHGIAGTPRQFDDFVPLVPRDMSLAVICLEGHGGSVRDFSRSSMAAWKAQVERWVRDLSKDHERIILVGHSMGTLLTAGLAERYPRVAGLLLMNVPLRVRLAPEMVGRSMRFCFGKLREDVPAERALMRCAGVKAEPWLWKYLGWIPRFLELLILCRESRAVFDRMPVKCCVFQGEHDEMVRSASGKYLTGKENVIHRVMAGSGHYDYAPEEFAKVLGCFEQLLKE